MAGIAPDPSGEARRDRWVWLGVAAGASLALGVGRALAPAPGGVGTHEQLGLPPCAFLALTGWPCPSCGLTTSFAHAARLDFGRALVTQPFGLLAFGLTLLLIPLGLGLARARVPWSRLIFARGADLVVYTLLALYVLSWLYKIAAMR